jgi:sulfate permease, SulP family
MKELAFKSYMGDLLGGIVGALITIPIILSCGVISYQNIGPAYITMGISAAFLTSIIAALLSGIFGKQPLHINSPKTTHAAILSGLMVSIASTHAFSTTFSITEAPLILILIGLITLSISGFTQMLLGGFKLGFLVKFIPYPVLAGFINGFALQIILNQLPKALGLDKEKDLLGLFDGHFNINLWALLLALFSGLIVVILKKVKYIPPALIALILGTLVHLEIDKKFPKIHLGPIIGYLPKGIHLNIHWEAMTHLMASHFFLIEIIPILITGVTLAFISSIQSLLSISSTEHLFSQKHNSNRELLIQGASNFFAAILGGVPTGGSPNTTQAVYANGGRTQISNIVFALAILVITYWFNSIIALIPLSVMAGVVIVTTISSIDKWTRELLFNIGSSENAESQRDVMMNLIVVVVVTLLVVLSSAIVALMIGLLGVFIAFLYRSNARMIRRTLYATHFHSRTEREHKHMEILEKEGHQIAIVELDGPIFFGSSESIAKYLDSILPQISWLILDLKRVSHMDSSGAIMLKRLDENMQKINKKLLLSYLPEKGNRRRFLQDMGYTRAEKEGRIYINTDMALSFAEDTLIENILHLPISQQNIELKDFEILNDFTENEINILKSIMIQEVYPAHSVLFKDLVVNTSKQLLFLQKGRISVYSKINDKKIRSASYLAGMCVGDLTLSPPNHEQEFFADSEVSILKLDLESLSAIETNSQLVLLQTKLFKNLALELSYKIIELHDVILELEEN